VILASKDVEKNFKKFTPPAQKRTGEAYHMKALPGRGQIQKERCVPVPKCPILQKD